MPCWPAHNVPSDGGVQLPLRKNGTLPLTKPLFGIQNVAWELKCTQRELAPCAWTLGKAASSSRSRAENKIACTRRRGNGERGGLSNRIIVSKQ